MDGVWCEVIHALSVRPRIEFLEHLKWFSDVIVYLGEAKAAEETAESILEIGRWWP